MPPTPIQEVRELTRTRKQLAREVIQHTNRIEKVLEDTNIKIASAISDMLGKSGRAILNALVTGETDPEKLVALCSGRFKASRKVFIEALRSRVTTHHWFLLKLHLGHVDLLQQGMRDLETRMGESLEPFRQHIENLTTIPGIGGHARHRRRSRARYELLRDLGNLISWAGFVHLIVGQPLRVALLPQPHLVGRVLSTAR
jgi:transposase